MSLRTQLCKPFDGLRTETVDELEKICEDFAIGFGNYVDSTFYQHEIKKNCYAKCEEDFHSGKTYTIKKLLKLYKETL